MPPCHFATPCCLIDCAIEFSLTCGHCHWWLVSFDAFAAFFDISSHAILISPRLPFSRRFVDTPPVAAITPLLIIFLPMFLRYVFASTFNIFIFWALLTLTPSSYWLPLRHWCLIDYAGHLLRHWLRPRQRHYAAASPSLIDLPFWCHFIFHWFSMPITRGHGFTPLLLMPLACCFIIYAAGFQLIRW